jgi:hypothetical protein
MLKRNGVPSPRTVARKGYARSPKKDTNQDGYSVLAMLIICGVLAALVQIGVI